MKRLLLMILFIILVFDCKSQDRYSLESGDAFVDSLKSIGVTQSILFKNSFPGMRISFDSPELNCEFEYLYFDLYIIWQENNLTKLKKFNNCFEFDTKQSDTISIFSNYGENRRRILAEDKRFEKKSERSNSYVSVNHSSTLFLKVNLNDKHDVFYVKKSEIKYNPKVYKGFETTKLNDMLINLEKLAQIDFRKIN